MRIIKYFFGRCNVCNKEEPLPEKAYNTIIKDCQAAKIDCFDYFVGFQCDNCVLRPPGPNYVVETEIEF